MVSIWRWLRGGSFFPPRKFRLENITQEAILAVFSKKQPQKDLIKITQLILRTKGSDKSLFVKVIPNTNKVRKEWFLRYQKSSNLWQLQEKQCCSLRRIQSSPGINNEILRLFLLQCVQNKKSLRRFLKSYQVSDIKKCLKKYPDILKTAILKKNIDAVQTLLAYRADPNAVTFCSMPLEKALSEQKQLRELLMENGAQAKLLDMPNRCQTKT